MPELPEVETIICGIKNQIINQEIADVIVRQRKLRWLIPRNIESKLIHSVFCKVSRRGKYLLLIANHGTLILHLGMSGKLQILPGDHLPDKHEHFAIVFANGKSLCLTDPRRFGAVLWTALNPLEHKLLASLGPEPLTVDFSADYLFSKCKNRTTKIKSLLMDSHIVVGVGNIYASEALFFAGVLPCRLAKSLTAEESAKLVRAVKEVLKKAIKKGGTTIRDYVTSDGNFGCFQNYLHVYGRTGTSCRKCNTLIEEQRLGNRSTFYCPKCQR